MKRTTYILIGILVLGLLVLLAFVFYASVAGNKPLPLLPTFPVRHRSRDFRWRSGLA